MPRDVRNMLGIIGGLLILAGVLLLIVPAENIWPFVLGFWAVGVGLVIGTAASANASGDMTG